MHEPIRTSDLSATATSELRTQAVDQGVDNACRLQKSELVASLLKAHLDRGEELVGDGVIEVMREGFGFLRDRHSGYEPGPADVFVPKSLVAELGLRTGLMVRGSIDWPRRRRGPTLRRRRQRWASRARARRARLR